jgi:RHS repeat-associated protein
LEITGVNSNASLTLHGTSSDQVYSLLSVTNLGNTVWHTEGVFSGAAGQDWTDLSLAGGASSNQLFFRAMRWATNEQPGDGISVTLTNPPDGASFDLWPTNLTLQATASATNGSILAVAFYHGTNLLGLASDQQYHFTWNNVGRGRYTLYARAFDSNGASASSPAVQVNVDPCYPALDVALVMDISSSMSGTPLTNAKAAGSNFVQKLDPNFDLVGLASFASSAVINTNLTSDRAGVAALLYSLVSSSGTRIDYGISTGQLVLASSRRQPPDVLRVMILLTDGNAEGGTSNLVVEAAQAAKTNGTRLFTLGIGNNVSTNLLSAIASHPTDFYYAPDSTNLNALYDSIAAKLCRTNAAPSVSIISPTNWATFTAGSNLNLQATASDPDGTIASVQFFNNGSFIGTPALTGSVYQLIWSEAPIGTNSLMAVATDNFGLAGTSQSITITVTHPPPTVQITSPANGQLFVLSPTNIVIQAEASATDAVITNVQFLCNGTNLGQCASSPYQVLWTNVAAGSNYTLTAVASDSMGATATTNVTVSVNAMPLVWITYPTNTTPTNLASFLEVTNITLRATATDNDGVITNVQFWSPTGQISGVVFTNSGTNFYLTLSNCHHRAYPFTAIATDNRGAASVSEIRVFKVTSSNLPPTVNLTNPVNGAVFSAGTDLTLCATASSTNGIALVEFFQNGVRLGGDDTPPYQLAVHGLWPGSYQFCAKATDSNGLATVSAVITNTVLDWVPLSANGYWDPAFRTFDYNPGYWPNSVPLTLGASNQVFAFFFADEFSGVQSWQSCAWLGANGLDKLAFIANTMIPYGANILLGGYDFITSATNYIVASYDGTGLTDLSFGLNAGVYALYNFKGDIIAGGLFTQANDNTNVPYVAKLTGDAWVPVGSALNGDVLAIASIGDDLYIGGDFTSAGDDTNVAYVAKLVGTNWVALGTGVNGPTNLSVPNGMVRALAVWNGQLVAGGRFTQAGGDTNAAYLAKWDGASWSPLGNALLSSDDTNYTPLIAAIAAHGNDLFVGGLFDTVTGSSGLATQFGNVAHLQWDPSSVAWNWSAMDGGVTNDPDRRSFVSSLLLRPSSISNALDVIVGGNFKQAGPAVSYQVGRWVIGANDCTNAYLPSVMFYTPLSSQTYLPGTDIGVGVTATATTGSQIINVDFYTNGVILGTVQAPGSTNDYSPGFVILQQGTYRFDAVAVDSSNLVNQATIYVNVASNSGPALSLDQYVVFVNDPPTPLYVLTNDSGAVGIKSVSPFRETHGTIAIAPGGTNLIFQPAPNTYGTVLFSYSATNATGIAGYTTVTVKIREKPIVALATPADGASLSTSSNVAISGAVLDYDTTNTSLAFYVNGSLVAQYAPTNINYLANPTSFPFGWNPAAACPQTSYALFSLNWTTNVPGYYKVSVAATDGYGYVSSSDALTPLTVALTNSFTATNLLVASIDNLPVTTNASQLVSYTIIHDGFFDLQGKARDPIATNAVSYQLLLYQPSTTSDTPFANVTPAPRDAAGFHSGGDITNSLGRLDLSTIPNGAYDLVLIVHGGGAQTNATARFILDSQLKIGQFSFSEQDLVLPVNGIPLTVTRTYNSLNSQLSTLNSQPSTDFGPGWTYALNSMDVQLDDERQDVTTGSDRAYADDDTDASGLPKVVSIRTGGGLDVTLTLPDGRRTTFAFNPRLDPWNGKAYAQWISPPGVYAVLTNMNPLGTEIDFFPSPHWASDDFTFGLPDFNCHDVPGWELVTQDGTQYHITRGTPDNVVYDTTGWGNFVNVRAYGPPALTKIVQRTGDRIEISPTGIAHYATYSSTPTRSVWFDRDSQNRITAIHDMISGSNGLPVVKYVYNEDTGNLIQVLKLTDRAAGSYTTNKYRYDNPTFRHYITSIDNDAGIAVARNFYDDAGRLAGVMDANGNLTQVIHNLTNRLEVVIDRLGHTNISAYDLRGNVIATTNALNGITLRGYDDNNNPTNEVMYLNGVPYATNQAVFSPDGFLLASINALQNSNTFTVNSFGQVLTSTDARHHTSTNYYDEATGNLIASSDALGNVSSNYSNSSGLLAGTRDPLGTRTTNYFDSVGNVIASGTLDSSGAILITNTAAFDANGNQTNSVTWRRVNGLWVGATNGYLVDAQNRRVATVAPDGGVSRTVFNNLGQAVQTIDALNHTNFHAFDLAGRGYQTTYPDGYSELTLFDAGGTPYAHVDREWRTNYTLLDGLNRPVGTVFADGVTNRTVLDDLGRVRFAVDGRGVTNASGYNAAGERTSLTNALGTPQQAVYRFGFDENGNEVWSLQPDATGTTNLFDALNRQITTLFADGTGITNLFDAAGNRIGQINQDGITNLFGVNGLGALVAVTNAFGTTNQAVTRYLNDEAGNQVAQVDALNRTNRFEGDAMGRRTKHTLPGGQSESWGFDLAGNEIRHTNFNGVVITNQFDVMSRCTNRTSIGYFASFAFSPTGQRTNMVDQTGSTSYQYNVRDWLTNKVVTWSGGPVVSLHYGLDANGNVTNIWSSTSGGVNLVYSLDALNRITNVLAGGSQAASYSFDLNGNLKGIRYGTGITNLCQYDLVNRLTNSAWMSNQLTLASFYYELGKTGNRTNLTETLLTSVTNRTYAWSNDSLYRLRQETISGLGTVSYGLDAVGNRTNRQSTVTNLPSAIAAYGSNDWLITDAYDSNGNTLWTTNSGIPTGPYYYNPLDWLTNFNNTTLFGYNGDGARVKKTVGSTNFFYLVDDRNPSGYAQLLEEWTVTAGATNLARVYNWGVMLISQREAGGTLYYFIPDGHGSTRLLTDDNGTVANAFAFDAYGNLLASNGPPQTAHLYCGEYFDAHLRSYYLRAPRYLNPDTGRFTTGDTFEGNQEDPLSLHKYLFCADNPVNKSDPSGNDATDDILSVLDIIGTLNTRISAPPVGSVAGTGGPDVTKPLKRTLLEVQAAFWGWSRSQKIGAAERMRDLVGAVFRKGSGGRGGAADAWDIIPLMETGFQDSPPFYLYVNGQQYATGSGLWGRSVAFNGRCYYAGAVNYALWGAMNRCVYDWLQLGPLFTGLDANEYTLGNALHTMEAWKHFKYHDFGTTEREAEEFTAYGFNGTPPSMALPCKPSGAVVQAAWLNWCWEPVKPRR